MRVGIFTSCGTAASGLARSFGALALARVGVGIGEAAGSPPAHALISDYFPPQRRATALAVYATGVYIGAMIAYMAGGYIVEHFDWRTAFFVVGVPGIPLALLVRFTVREPLRGRFDGGASESLPVGMREVIQFLWRQRSFVYIVAAVSCQAIPGYAILAWGPTFLRRVHGMESVQIGTWLGLMIGVGGSLGALLGGVLGDRLGARDARWYMYLSALVCTAAIPCCAAFLLLEDRNAALLAFLGFYLLANMYLGPMLSMLQGLVKVHMRATASAIHLFILNMVGLGAGPLVVGFLNDHLSSRFGNQAIRYSLLAVVGLSIPAGACFWLASRTLREDLEARDAR